MEEVQELRAVVAQLSAQLQTLAAAVASLSHDSGGGGEEDFSQDDSWQDMVPGPGGGGTHMGNTDDSEEIDGDATFESADDSNVEVTTEKRTEGDEEVNVIKIGVYYI